MIRREERATDGAPQWMLIPQIEHARLSGELADHWGAGSLGGVPCRDQVLPAIYHHDDGWRQWDQAPQLDPESDRPYAFTEMPLAAALEIWDGSIEAVDGYGPLASWIVAGHFSALLRESSSAQTEAASAWLADCDQRRTSWLAAWHDVNPTDHQLDVADRALGYLQLFDALSLWLCCAHRDSPHTMATPAGAWLTVTPAESSQIMLSPWPLDVDRLELHIMGDVVSATQYHDARELRQAYCGVERLGWELVPVPVSN